jgi:class 3 adenylate cyclase/tetratricopeptide (TPR) repeat protein
MTGTQTVTVLVTDLVSSTELRVALGEDRAEALRRRHDALLAQAVTGHQGTLVKGLGDGVLALFPSAADAIAAAVVMQQSVDVEWARSDAGLAIRVGVSAGDVTLENGDCFGTPVVEASRLCAVAQGGQILVAELVRLLARGRGDHTFEDAGLRELKGLPDAVPTFTVGWERLPGAGSVPMPAPLNTREIALVGRAVELEGALRAWKSALEGDRQVVLLAGEPGIGKTRLAAEVAGIASRSGAVVLYGRCDEGMGVAFQPFVEALSHLVDSGEDDALAGWLGRHPGDLVRLVPELAERLPTLEPPLRSDPETERYRLFDAVTSWLTATAAPSGLVLVLDDLHWAEKPTLLLLRHLIRSSGPMRLLVVGTYRDTDLDRAHPLASLLADFRREPDVERIAVEGLDPTGVAGMLEAAAGHDLDEQAEELARAIWGETEGNPFFVGEVLRSLVESAAIFQRDGRWTSDLSIDQIAIPEGVREVIGRRLGRLSDDANLVLSVASVIGPDFDLELLVGVSGLGEDAVLDAIDQATVAHLVREAGVGRWRFAHALVRSTLYEELSVTRRARRHQQVAEFLESSRTHDAAILAYHFSRSGGGGLGAAEKAISYTAEAGWEALAQLAPDQGMAFFRQALDLLDDVGEPADRRRCDLMIGLGTAQRNAGDPTYRETFLAAAGLAQDLGDADALARAAAENSRGFVSFVGTCDEERVAVLDAAYRALPPGDSPLRARVCATLGGELIFTSRRDERFRLIEEAIAVARRLDDHRTLGDVLVPSLPALAVPDRLEQNQALVEELVGLAASLEDPRMQVFAASWAFFMALDAGDGEEIDRNLDTAMTVASEIGEPGLRVMAASYHACRVLLRGDLEEAERRALEAFELGQQIGQPDALEWLAAHLTLIRIEQDRAAEVVDGVLAYAGMYPEAPAWKASAAWLLSEAGRSDEAGAIVDALAVDGFAAVPYDYLWLYAMCASAEVAVACGQVEHAEVLYWLLLPYAGQLSNYVIGASWSVSTVLGRICTLLGRYEEAEERFRAGLEMDTRLGRAQFAARTQRDWARMLLQRGGEGDRARALELVARALETARRRGYVAAERRARAIIASAR